MNGSSTTLTRQDRCDRCGAGAVLRAELAGGVLLFCGHHARRHAPRLRADGARLAIELVESHSWVDPRVPAAPTEGET